MACSRRVVLGPLVLLTLVLLAAAQMPQSRERAGAGARGLEQLGKGSGCPHLLPRVSSASDATSAFSHVLLYCLSGIPRCPAQVSLAPLGRWRAWARGASPLGSWARAGVALLPAFSQSFAVSRCARFNVESLLLVSG